MPEFMPKAKENLDRSTHPDLVRGESGELVFRDDVDLPANERDWRRRWASETDRAAMMSQITRWQQSLPESAQYRVASREFRGYDNSGDPWQGYLQYRREIADEMQADPNVVTGAMVANMSLAEYEAKFDANGRPKPGVVFEVGGRDVDVSDRGSGIDYFSAREFRNR